MAGDSALTPKELIRSEKACWAGIVTAVLFLTVGSNWLADLSNPLWYAAMFAWLFAVMLWAAFGVVKHADSLAVKLGEPYALSS
jgi:Ca2+:H+ antiporter